MGIQQPVISETCGYPFPVDFFKMLASCLVRDTVTGDVLGIRVMFTVPNEGCGCEPMITCDNAHLPPETWLPWAFGLDNCGNLALKLVNCDATICDAVERCIQ